MSMNSEKLVNIPKEYLLSTYQFDLPAELIAQSPAANRDESLLLVFQKRSGRILHKKFSQIGDFLRPGDVLVINDSKVVPALIRAKKKTGGSLDLLVVNPSEPDGEAQDFAVRTCIARTGKRCRAGMKAVIRDDINIEILEIEAPGKLKVRFPVKEFQFLTFLEQYGEMPLPPYIKRRNHNRDVERYQTVYSKDPGSVAAPTAGFHFTTNLLSQLKTLGVIIARVRLHVGPGTFKPVKSPDIRNHRMESEYYDIPVSSADFLNEAIRESRRIIGVGTTSVRTLESAVSPQGIRNGKGSTSLFITPGYSFNIIRNMVTNFHLPGSTLFMLVCALGGTENMKRAYDEAKKRKYSFYSYGDACLILD